MTDDEPFLRAIAAAPAEDLPRLIYADWLDERGDRRGELIRVQCELARLPDGDPAREPLARRELELLRAHGWDWHRQLRRPPTGDWDGYYHPLTGQYLPHFRRGMPCSVRIDYSASFGEYAAEVFALFPVEFVRFSGPIFDLDALLACPALRGVKSLSFDSAEFNTDDALSIADAETLTGLAQLDLPDSQIGDLGAEAVMTSPVLRRLTGLDLSHNSLVGVSLSVADGSRFERLDLTGNPLMRGWAGSVLYWPRLVSLGLSGTGVTPEELSELPRQAMLRRLCARENSLREDLAPVLANSLGFGRLRELNLGQNVLGLATVEAIATAPHFGQLERLVLDSSFLGPAAGEILAASRTLTQLTRLELGYCGLRDAGVMALARAKRWPRLRFLDLEENGIGEAGCRALADSDLIDQLDVLILHHNPLGPSLERLMARAPGRVRV